MGMHPSAKLVYGVYLGDGDAMEQMVKALGLEEEAISYPDDPGSLYTEYADDNGLALVYTYGFEYPEDFAFPGFILAGKNTKRFEASFDPKPIPGTLPEVDSDDQRRLNAIAAKLNTEPSWFLVPFYG